MFVEYTQDEHRDTNLAFGASNSRSDTDSRNYAVLYLLKRHPAANICGQVEGFLHVAGSVRRTTDSRERRPPTDSTDAM
jgi:hypothetical protein